MTAPRGHARRALVWPLLALLLFLSVSAQYGGYLLAVDPSGDRLQMPGQLLAGTPFPDFRVPGVFLFCALGVGPLVAFVGQLTRARWAFAASLASGLLLIGWIVIQVALVGYISWLQPVFGAVGLVIAALSYLAHRRRLPGEGA